jgi:hypothetical protein
MKMTSINHSVQIEFDEFELGLLNNCLHCPLMHLPAEECERLLGANQDDVKRTLEEWQHAFAFRSFSSERLRTAVRPHGIFVLSEDTGQYYIQTPVVLRVAVNSCTRAGVPRSATRRAQPQAVELTRDGSPCLPVPRDRGKDRLMWEGCGVCARMAPALGIALQGKSLPEAILVKADGPRFDLQNLRDFPPRSAFGQQLQDLPLAWRQLLLDLHSLATPQQALHHVFVDLGRKVAFSSPYLA